MIDIIIGIGIAAVVALIIGKMVKDKKSGKGGCGCGCSSCPSAGICHSNEKQQRQK